ncbi:MAG: phosphatase PAP2 family protein [Thermodesulfovibrionales bacterium]
MISPARDLRPADALNIAFASALALTTIAFFPKIPAAPLLLCLYGALVALQILLVRIRGRSAAVRFVSDLVFPTASILIIFDSLERIVHHINPRDIDALLIRLDYLIFGGHPTVLLERVHHPLLTDILQAAYASYYFLPVGLGVFLLAKKRRADFDRSLFLIMYCFYLSYVGYLLAPAIGPRFTMDHLQSVRLTGLVVAEPIQEILNRLEGIKRDAFPSGHTAIALTVLCLARRYEKKLFLLFLPLVTLLIAATVYCRYHYAIDVFAGIALACAAVWTGDRIYDRWTERAGPRR